MKGTNDARERLEFVKRLSEKLDAGTKNLDIYTTKEIEELLCGEVGKAVKPARKERRRLIAEIKRRGRKL